MPKKQIKICFLGNQCIKHQAWIQRVILMNNKAKGKNSLKKSTIIIKNSI